MRAPIYKAAITPPAIFRSSPTVDAPSATRSEVCRAEVISTLSVIVSLDDDTTLRASSKALRLPIAIPAVEYKFFGGIGILQDLKLSSKWSAQAFAAAIACLLYEPYLRRMRR